MKPKEPNFLFNYLLWFLAVPVLWILGYILVLEVASNISSDTRFPFVTLLYFPALLANLVHGLALRRFGINLLLWTLVTLTGYVAIIAFGNPGFSIVPAIAQGLVLKKHADRWLIWGVALTIAIETQYLGILLLSFFFAEANSAVYIPVSIYFTILTGVGAHLSKLGPRPS